MTKKYVVIFLSVAVIMSGCTWANPNQDAQTTNSGQTAEFQKDQQVTDEELIRYNLYPNPTEYYEQEDLDRRMQNTRNRHHELSETEVERNQMTRDLYYEIMQLEEVRQAGISITENQIHIAINLENRSDRKKTVEKIKAITEEMTDRTDVYVDVDPDLDTRIE